MVDGIGPTSAGRMGAIGGVSAVARVSRTGLISRAAAAGSIPNPAAELGAFGPPVDAAKVEALRKAIAAGAYKPEPKAIADKMVALDLPTAAPAPTTTPATTGKGGNGAGK